MSPEEIMAAVSLVGSLIGTLSGIVISNKLTMYRIEQLEKKVEKHNNVVERTALVENDLKSVWHNVDEIKEDIEHLRSKEGE
jgi:demethoxyubiquinone hydroxylase (CLK1/Coq7/Cat5 family)